MRNITLILILATIAGAFAADGDIEKLRALSEARIKVLEKVVAEVVKNYYRGQAAPEQVIASTERLFNAKLELAASQEERVALAEKNLASQKELRVSEEARFAAGQVVKMNVDCAEIEVLKAELMLSQLKKTATAENVRTFSAAKLKHLELVVEATNGAFARGMRRSLDVHAAQQCVRNMRMELATTPEERVAVAETFVEGAKAMHALTKAQALAGQVGNLELDGAELKILEAELALSQLKKQDDAEKRSAYSKARLKHLENVAELKNVSFKRGFSSTFDVMNANSCVQKAKLELAASIPERVALLEQILARAREFQVMLKAVDAAGQATVLEDLYLAELNVIEAEQALLQLKQP